MAQKPEKEVSGAKKEKTPSSTVPVKRVGEAPAAVRGPRHLWPMSAWETEIERWFDDFRRRMHLPGLWEAHRGWPAADIALRVPAVDVYEQGDEVVVKAEIPGLSKDEIQVNLTDSMLTVKGEKKKEEEVKDDDYYRCERSFGSFSRSVELPSAVKAEQVKATFKDGVLEVRLPKTEEAKRKQIKVDVQ